MGKLEEFRKKLIQKARKKVTEKLEKKEVGAIKTVGLIEDLDFSFNVMAEQVLDWYSYHFPELQRLANDSETTLKLIGHLGQRKNFLEQKVFEQYNNQDQAKKISETAKNSTGAEFDEKEINEIKMLAINTLNLKEERKFLTKFLEQKMNSIAPNFSGLCGPVLGAKFLNKAGSLKKLAFMPSSTIQVLGAESALFSHLRKKTKPPKHGYLFSHPLVKQVGPKQKGKAARMLAAKLAIAIKQDYFGTGKTSFEKLKKELEEKVKTLNEKKTKKNF